MCINYANKGTISFFSAVLAVAELQSYIFINFMYMNACE